MQAGLLHTWKANPWYLEGWLLVYLEGGPMQANLELLLKLGEDLDESNPRFCQQLVPGYILVWIIYKCYYYSKILKH
jgi:hypothetical protein